MMKKAATLGLVLALVAGPMFANEGAVPKGIPRLEHVWVIMMENHAYAQIVDNPNAPFTNKLAKSANTANNYFAVAHPSLTNYLEVVGGSNFGILNDHNPDWHNTNCTTNLASGLTSFDTGAFPNVCPIWGEGKDAATPVFDLSNETTAFIPFRPTQISPARRLAISWRGRARAGRAIRRACLPPGRMA